MSEAEKSPETDAGYIWLASYPKSGNTYLRHLMEAYRCNGALDINSPGMATGDAGAALINGVSPMAVKDLGFRGEALIRPAMLLQLYSKFSQRRPLIKTHSANLCLPRLPPFIPKEFTHSAIYVVRDPRDVLVSCLKYWEYPPERGIEALGRKEFVIGGCEKYARCMVSSWSNHAASWIGEKEFPVHIVSYEELVSKPAEALTEVLNFIPDFGEVDEKRVKVAVEAASIAAVQKQEQDKGFIEHAGRSAGFFASGGGSRWRDELAPKHIRQVEKDHGKMMKLLGYELAYETGLEEQEGNVYGLRSIESGN